MSKEGISGMDHYRAMTGQGLQALTLGVLQEYFTDQLARPIANEIAMRYVQSGTRTLDQMERVDEERPEIKGFQGHPLAEQPAPTPDRTRLFPRPGEGLERQQRVQYLSIGEVRSRGQYIKENTETGICKLYDQTGTYIGAVSNAVMDELHEGGEITTRHEDETYDTHWIKEETRG